MRIAEIAPPWFPVPPPGYGGIELVVGLVADGLVERGHDVTLFASGGSRTTARLVCPLEAPPDPRLLGNVHYEALHATVAYDSAEDFDVVHDHSGVIGPILAARRVRRPPVVHTLHGPWTEVARRLYRSLDHEVDLVSISEAQRRDESRIRYAGTVYNGIDLDAYPLGTDREDLLVWIGRSNPEKAPELAIELARRVGLPLTMVVKRREPVEERYWNEVVEPMLRTDVTVVESITHAEKVALLGRARAFVFPIRWSEPFGLVMVEAMACGTPVLAHPLGAAPELVEDGVSGYLRETVGELAETVAFAGSCSPAACRARVADHFSSVRMVDSYERLLRAVTSREDAGHRLLAGVGEL